MLKKPSLIKPNLSTKFAIDFDWWKSQDQNWRNSLISCLCPEHREAFASHSETASFDLVDQQTGEVSQGDALLDTLVNHCAKQENFIQSGAPLVDSIFKVFLSNHNQALNCEELSQIVHKPATTILSTIGSFKVYKGIRPV